MMWAQSLTKGPIRNGLLIGLDFTQKRYRRWELWMPKSIPDKKKNNTVGNDIAIGSGAIGAATQQKESPENKIVSTTPFQATRLLQAFCITPSQDQPIYLNVRVAVDLKRESVRGVSQLPHSVGRQIRLAVFCPDEEAPEMIKAGADYAGVTELCNSISQGKVDFDKCIASPDVMSRVIKLAKVLGPRKLMPNQKSNTVVTNLIDAIKQAKSGAQMEFRAEGLGDIKVQIGNTAFPQVDLLNNMKKLIKDITAARPRSNDTGDDGGDSNVFHWPPLSFSPQYNLKKRTSTIQALRGGVKSGGSGPGNDNEFIVAGVLESPGLPSVRIEGMTLKPSSTGYFR